MEGGGSIRLDALTQVVGQSLLSAYSTFCMNDRFDYLSSRTVLEGREVRRYDPFDDAPVEGDFDWLGLAWNLLYGVMVTAVLAVAAVATGGAALFVGAAVAAGVTTLFITATDVGTGNVRSHDQTKRDIGFAAIIGALTGGVGGFLKGVEIFANPFADMAIKEVIESCVSTRAGIALRSLEAIGLPPEERLAYIYDWKMLALDFGLGTLIGIGLGSAGIAFRGAAGEAVERAVKEGMEDTLEGAGTYKIFFDDFMSPEEARKYLEFFENGSTAGLRPEELLGIQKVDDYLALSRVDYDEVLRLRTSIIQDGADVIEIGRADLDALRNRWGVLNTNTIAIGKTNVKGLEGIVFEGGSPTVRTEMGLPNYDISNPNRIIRSPGKIASATRHAEEVVVNEFVEAVENSGLRPEDVVGTLKIHQSNPSGVCPTCLSGLGNPDKPAGVIKQLSLKYPNLLIDVTSETVEGVKINGNLAFKVKNGKYIH